MNNFYAIVECLYNPTLRDKPLAVGSQGDSYDLFNSSFVVCKG
ncbi:hypothetical protein [Metaclostridioides mangenotii]|nr:hypothetical protein [Clostridioides mangenotii]